MQVPPSPSQAQTARAGASRTASHRGKPTLAQAWLAGCEAVRLFEFVTLAPCPISAGGGWTPCFFDSASGTDCRGTGLVLAANSNARLHCNAAVRGVVVVADDGYEVADADDWLNKWEP